jgi:hypothetical protein
MPNNEAAWLVSKHAPLQVKDAPYTEPGAGEILVSNDRAPLSRQRPPT